MRKFYGFFVIGFAALAVGIGVGLLSANIKNPSTGEADESTGGAVKSTGSGQESSDAKNPYADFKLADFSLLNQDAETVDSESFEGEVTATVFFFTRCPGPCPTMIATLAGIAKDTAEVDTAKRLRFAAISVDGERDSPEVLKAYAERLGLDLERWTFLTGAPETVKQLVRDSLDYELRVQEPDPLAPHGRSRAFNILHPTRIMLIGPDRQTIGIYRYADTDDIERLISDATAALAG